jgi:hypothetical protein
MNPIVPERPQAEQPRPAVPPTWVVLPPVVEERSVEQQAALEETRREARVWARVAIERLSRAQAAIDWSKDAGAQIMAEVRANQEWVNWLLLAVFLRVWVGWWT